MNELGKFDYSQVITEEDLKAIAGELFWIHNSAPWYRPLYKYSSGITYGVIIGLIYWLKEGKNTAKHTESYE